MSAFRSWLSLARLPVMLVLAGLLVPCVALAHHGWSWTADGFFRLSGIVRTVYLGNPHATLDVDVEGEIWRVELAPPSRTRAAGLDEAAIAAGDEVVAIGNRSRDDAERRMKAVRIEAGGRTYDVYPGRVPTN